MAKRVYRPSFQFQLKIGEQNFPRHGIIISDRSKRFQEQYTIHWDTVSLRGKKFEKSRALSDHESYARI